METIYTIGHSTHLQDEFIKMLKVYAIEQLVDVRSIPRSRHNPQFEQTVMEHYLPEAGIAYVYLKSLGGLRPAVKDSINLGWHNLSFRNYADYMQTPEFTAGLDELIALGKTKRTAIMYAEAVPWRCHRSLIADALTVRDITVIDIMSATHTKEHTLTPFAKVQGLTITYPESPESV